MSEQGDLLALTVLYLGLKISLGEYSISRNLAQRGLKRKTGIPKFKYGVPGIVLAGSVEIHCSISRSMH
ncbi:MAG: hypothetical protein A2W74_07155 [Planctomycetes bacterium RIFCSPLOWO2_12_38_17]|nr:MAG: hypothetical protein A2W74_07155 [Planctomycetes bacterium RIFCSPLOWO2_12_38_17]